MSNPYLLIKQFVLLTGFWMAAVAAAQAQQSYYICIQSENGQPFYTQIGDRVYSSSAVGHLIISGLKDNVCNLEIGFPQHTSRPQQFSVPIHGKDKGYQLKKNGSQDWALVSWQGQETIKPKKGPGSSDLLYGERKKDDAFAALMAAVVNDSAVLYTSIVRSDAPVAPTVAKSEEKQAVVDTAAAAITTTPAKPLYDTTAAVAKVNTNDKPLFDTTSAVKKPYINEKPLFDTTMAKAAKPPVEPATVPEVVYDTTEAIGKDQTDKPLFDTAALAKVPKNNTNIIDLTTGKPLYDTAVIDEVEEPAAKESNKVAAAPVKKVDKLGVIKVQQTKKDGETKIVFIDSSESPADVVTVYINEEPVQPGTPAPPVSNDLNIPAPKTEPEQKAVIEKKPDSVKKTDTVLKEEAAPKTAPAPAGAKKEETKPAVSTVTPTVNEMRPVTEKPAAKKGDTLVVILESPQQKRDTAVKNPPQEAPKPLYAPRETTVDKPVVSSVNDQPAIAPETGKPAGKPGRKGRAAKNADDTVVPAAADKKDVVEPAKQEVASDADVNKNDAAAKPKAVYDPKPTELDKKVVMINSDCNRFATEADVDKLRVKMLNEKDVNRRVTVANKVFRSMCLTAKQIKALTELFPSDETKYRFLEMAYPFAADTSNFKELFELFSSEAYQTKFKTMVRY